MPKLIVAIYKNSDYAIVSKEDLQSIFKLPGEYFVFEIDYRTFQLNTNHKDPYIFYKNENEIETFKIGYYQLIDTSIRCYKEFTKIEITIFNHFDKSTRKIERKYQKWGEHAYKQGLIDMVTILNNLSKSNNWDELKKIEELEDLKNQLIEIKNEVNFLKKQLSSISIKSDI